MSVSRIKSVTIAILLLINAIFLAVIIGDTIADARNERQSLSDACAVLARAGISLDPDNVKTAGAIGAMRTARDLDSEALIARTALGDAEMTDHGVIFSYESEGRGRAEFKSSGNFDIRLDEGAPESAGNAEKTVKKLLRKMKIETSELITADSMSPAGSTAPSYGTDSETIIAVCSYNGVSIFNCTIEFVFNNGSLESITGQNVNCVEPTEGGGIISTPGTMLLGLLAAIKRGDVEFSEIKYVEAGYEHHVAGSFEGVVSPAWLIVTDTGRYILDDATGEILSRRPEE